MPNSLIVTEGGWIWPIHPGKVLMANFIEGFGITQNTLAVPNDVSLRRITRSCTASAAAPRIRRSCWPNTLVRPRSIGSASRAGYYVIGYPTSGYCRWRERAGLRRESKSGSVSHHLT